MSVTAGYHRRTYGNLAVTDNLNLSVDEWTPFTITAPADERLPGGGGYPITMYTLNPTKVGVATDNLRTFSTLNSRVYNGVDLNVNARIGRQAFLLGGVTHERSRLDDCAISATIPNSLRFCDSAGPFRTMFKVAGSYELPYAIQVSGSFIAQAGRRASPANYTVTSAIAGRPIIGSTAGAAQIAVNLVEPNTMFRDYINQVDLRVARTFRFGKYRLQGLVDIYNLLNAGTVTIAQHDVWRGAGHARVAESAGDPDEPLRALRRAVELQKTRFRVQGSGFTVHPVQSSAALNRMNPEPHER